MRRRCEERGVRVWGVIKKGNSIFQAALMIYIPFQVGHSIVCKY